MIIIAIPLFVCVVGLALLVVGKPGVAQRVGEIMFFCGLLVVLLRLDSVTVHAIVR